MNKDANSQRGKGIIKGKKYTVSKPIPLMTGRESVSYNGSEIKLKDDSLLID